MEINREAKIKLIAGPVKRLMAFLIDILVLNIVFLVIFIAYSMLEYFKPEFWRIYFVIFVFYFTICDSYLMKGVSFGKFIFRIGVKTIDGKSLCVSVSLIRSFLTAVLYFILPMWSFLEDLLNIYFGEIFTLALLSGVTSILFVGYTIYMVFHPFNKGIHDTMCKSVVSKNDIDFSLLDFNDYSYSRISVCYIFMTGFSFLLFIILLLKSFFF